MRNDRRPIFAIPATRFGRGRRYVAAAAELPKAGLADDIRLFALTFAGGFLFMAVYLG